MRVTGTLVSAGLVVACSLTDLDGFTGGPTDAGGSSSSSSSSGAIVDSGATLISEAGSPEAGPPTDPYGDAVRADTPSSWWRFEDAPGSLTLHDEMGKFDGKAIPRGSTAIDIRFGVEGAVGKAAKFGNDTGYFDIADAYDFSGLSAFSLETWVSNDSPVADFEAIFHKRVDDSSGTPQNGWIIFFEKSSRTIGFQFWKNTNVNPGLNTGPLQTGFHHIVVAVTKRDGVLDFDAYLDGVSADSVHNNDVEQANTAKHLTLGFNNNGLLDEMAIYEHTLTPERVLAHYKAARSP